MAARLSRNSLKHNLLHHPFFRQIKTQTLTRDTVGIFLGQWWHPLHYFPTFLSRTISVVPSLGMKTAISKILYQELGEGHPDRAHERVYVATMSAVGFSEAVVSDASPFAATEQLVEGYRRACEEPLSALGFVYGTEVADLVMVAGIGTAVRLATGASDLPWVDIHISQEPDHVEQVNEAVDPTFAERDATEIVAAAERMWQLWIAFFSSLQLEMGHHEVTPGPGRVSREDAPAAL
jgi:pyrroloquinoline quinone (PQQ) biosynthesis protein C